MKPSFGSVARHLPDNRSRYVLKEHISVAGCRVLWPLMQYMHSHNAALAVHVVLRRNIKLIARGRSRTEACSIARTRKWTCEESAHYVCRRLIGYAHSLMLTRPTNCCNTLLQQLQAAQLYVLHAIPNIHSWRPRQRQFHKPRRRR
jgi:hypothetical protein